VGADYVLGILDGTILSFPIFLLCFSLVELSWNYALSLDALSSLITFSYTTNVREAAGRFFSKLDVMPL
jgi:hypothetical protein